MWGTITLGGIGVREELLASQSPGSLKIAGQESAPPSTRAFVEATHHNLRAMPGLVLPVEFTDKVGLTAFYRVTEAQSDLFRWANGSIQSATWSLALELIGSEQDVEIESRVPTIARATELVGITPVYWHAPPPGTDSYFTGPTVPPSTVVRTSADGDLTVQLGLPVGVSPRWTCSVHDYMRGSARVLFDNLRRIGTTTPQASLWELNNGLVRVVGNGVDGSFSVSCWDAGVWGSAKGYAVQVGGAALTGQPDVTILRNDPEEVTLRLTWPTTTGRTTCDLGLRRGSRFVTGIIKRHAAATLGVTRTAAEAVTAATGGVRATNVDADGNRFVMGSSRTTTNTLATASISKATVPTFDFFLGCEYGAAPAAGDTFAALVAQYLGSMGEQAKVVLR